MFLCWRCWRLSRCCRSHRAVTMLGVTLCPWRPNRRAAWLFQVRNLPAVRRYQDQSLRHRQGRLFIRWRIYLNVRPITKTLSILCKSDPRNGLITSASRDLGMNPCLRERCEFFRHAVRNVKELLTRCKFSFRIPLPIIEIITISNANKELGSI